MAYDFHNLGNCKVRKRGSGSAIRTISDRENLEASDPLEVDSIKLSEGRSVLRKLRTLAACDAVDVRRFLSVP